MMRLWPRTITGGAVLVLLAAVTLSHLVSMAAYHADLGRQLGANTQQQFIDGIVAAVRGIEATPAADRERAAQAIASPGADIRWTAAPPAATLESLPPDLATLREQIRQALPGLAEDAVRFADLHVGAKEGRGSAHGLVTAVRLTDSGWLIFSMGHRPGAQPEWTPLVLSTTVMVMLVVVVTIVLVRVLTRPLRQLSAAAKRLGVDVTAPPLPVAGPEEVREASLAFNEMQARLRRLIDDRTQMMAAMSHDLKTPLTRLRLRSEFVEDEHERERMLADISDMESMISSTLAFLKQGTETEETKLLDVASILESLCADHADLGHAVRYRGAAHAKLQGRHLALKRAFANLIGNAVTYGGGADVQLSEGADAIRVAISDRGPGIPPAEFEAVFQAFYRGEGSRNRETGGVGLGLTVARAIVRAHGGDIVLDNLQTGGLMVAVTLPRIGVDRAAFTASR
jgi:signal transduction histidine kinase